MATKEREEIKGTTKQKMARHYSLGRKHLGQECSRQKTAEGFDGSWRATPCSGWTKPRWNVKDNNDNDLISIALFHVKLAQLH